MLMTMGDLFMRNGAASVMESFAKAIRSDVATTHRELVAKVCGGFRKIR